ncbi:hypothetical protein NFT50_004403 [Salmonella enterica]|nr:hypothetical protein [Salmonella enterica]EJH7441137.1 hypothetical protein [Salmonella enterica]EJH7880506.1 hypothetical protein [Salmonella enterica]EJI6713255.1 hypothetical protein [Salmonella enterica]
MDHLVIQPLVRQHAANAAFYWHQKEESRFSPLVKGYDLRQFNEYINANLDGLRVAGEHGWAESHLALKRWHSHGEAFVCGVLAHQCQNSEWIMAVREYVYKYPDMTLDGYVAALSFAAKAYVDDIVNELLTSPNFLDTQVALGICAKLKKYLSEDLILLKLQSSDFGEKIAICNYIRCLGLQKFLPEIEKISVSSELSARFAVLHATCWLSSDKDSLIAPLCLLIHDYLSASSFRGLDGLKKNKELEILTRLLGQCCAQHSFPSDFILTLPEYLQVIFYAHYADTDKLPKLISFMEKDELSRMAFVAVSLITGIDIDDTEYLLPAQDEKLPGISSRLNVFGTGIGRPDIDKVASVCRQYGGHRKLLRGKDITIPWCHTNFSEESQLIRWIAAWHLFSFDKNIPPLDNVSDF